MCKRQKLQKVRTFEAKHSVSSVTFCRRLRGIIRIIIRFSPKIWTKLDCVSKTFRRLVNVITPAEGATERARPILGVKDHVAASEERGGKGEINKVDDWTKTERVGVAESNILRASIRSVRIWSIPISERISSKQFQIYKLRSSIVFGGVVTITRTAGMLITTAELEVKVLSDWGNRRKIQGKKMMLEHGYQPWQRKRWTEW